MGKLLRYIKKIENYFIVLVEIRLYCTIQNTYIVRDEVRL